MLVLFGISYINYQTYFLLTRKNLLFPESIEMTSTPYQ